MKTKVRAKTKSVPLKCTQCSVYPDLRVNTLLTAMLTAMLTTLPWKLHTVVNSNRVLPSPPSPNDQATGDPPKIKEEPKSCFKC